MLLEEVIEDILGEMAHHSPEILGEMHFTDVTHYMVRRFSVT